MASFAANPLIALFGAKSICVLGTVAEPLFKMADVARYIEDLGYRAVAKQLGSKFLVKLHIRREPNSHYATFLTEKGLYRYLTRSSRPAAEAFQDFVCDALVEARKAVVDAAMPEVKIARSIALRTPKFRETFDSIAVRKHLDRTRLGVLYFIRGGAFMKIGWTLHLPTRLERLQTGQPTRLRVVVTHICVLPYKHEKEALLHFAECWRSGEWFELSDAEALAYVSRLREEAALA